LGPTYQNADYRVMVWVTGVTGDTFYDIEEIENKSVINRH
jgi:hypothetical protein